MHRNLPSGGMLYFGGPAWTLVAVYRTTCDRNAVACVIVTPEGPQPTPLLPPGNYYFAVLWGGTDDDVYVY